MYFFISNIFELFITTHKIVPFCNILKFTKSMIFKLYSAFYLFIFNF